MAHMSIHYGRWSFDGRPVATDLDRAFSLLSSPVRNDIQVYRAEGGVGILSQTETQPLLTNSGAILTWDGRLDNREELLSEYRLSKDSSDAAIAAAGFERQGTRSFRKLLGDWALVLWNPDLRTLFLAKDFLGPRRLYYSADQDGITWSSLLDPLVLLRESSPTIDNEYVAGWIFSFPASERTPYVGIHSVPPASFVELQPGTCRGQTYWQFDSQKTIRYTRDADYEEHFRNVFSESVRRRLRSDGPVLAELSGGMDSSSIVCVADSLVSLGRAETPSLDTVSYFNDAEPNWDERPYFTLVEEQRGRTGFHIEANWEPLFARDPSAMRFLASPADLAVLPNLDQELTRYVLTHGNRVLLSGIGGDEMMGGVPTPAPELADLLAGGNVGRLAHQLKIWSLSVRKPWLHLFCEAVSGFLPVWRWLRPKQGRLMPWFAPSFLERHGDAARGYSKRWRVLGNPPSFQENLATLRGLQGQLAACPITADGACAKTYPYLDRDLLEFLFAIAREQLVRPGHRRSLMRRALAGIVPNPILSRRRKAFVARAPLVAMLAHRDRLLDLRREMISASLGMVDPRQFGCALERAMRGEATPVIPLVRTILLEQWFRQLFHRGLLWTSVSPALTGLPNPTLRPPLRGHRRPSLEPETLPVERR